MAEDQDRLHRNSTECTGAQEVEVSELPGSARTSWRRIEKRRKLKKKIGDARSQRLKERARYEYKGKDKEVTRSLSKDKRDWTTSIAQEAEDSARQGQMKRVYT